MVIVALIVLVRYVIPFFIPVADLSGVLVGMVGAADPHLVAVFQPGALVGTDWLTRRDRRGCDRDQAAGPYVDSNGFMNRMLYVYAVPASVAPALVVWALVSRRLSTRRAGRR